MSKPNTATVQLQLYSRQGCHLCEDMREALRDYAPKLGFDVVVIDIDTDLALVNRFGTKVPVLMHQDHEICHYFLDSEALQMYFSESPE